MKKFLFILFCFLSIACRAEKMWFRTTGYAEATITNGRYSWSDWQSSNLQLLIDTDADRVIVYSPKIQIYKVYDTYNNGNTYEDVSGGVNVMFYVVDQDGDIGKVRLRVEKNLNSQVYVIFNNCAWVYNVERTN